MKVELVRSVVDPISWAFVTGKQPGVFQEKSDERRGTGEYKWIPGHVVHPDPDLTRACSARSSHPWSENS